MELKRQKRRAIPTDMLVGLLVIISQLLFITLIPILLIFTLAFTVEFLEDIGMEKKVFLAIGFVFSIWFITSPFICLYWLFKPAELFWWKHKYISRTLFFGSFFSCVAIVTSGVHLFLWFIPDSWLLQKGVPFASWIIASAVGIIATFALWCKLTELLEQKRQKDRLERIEWKHRKLKYDLAEEKETIVGLRQEMRKLEQLQKENKLNPFLETRLIALEQVCEKYENPDLGRTTYGNHADPTPNDYGYDEIDGPIEAVIGISENVFNDCRQSQQEKNSEISRVQKEAIKIFLKGLTQTEKALVVLYYFEEMTIPEIAKSLDLSSSDVSQMHSSIISRCNVYLQEQESS